MGKPTDTTEYIVVTLPWIIIICGVIGNTFGAIILLRKRFRKRSFGVYLLAISFLDTIFLLSNTLLAWGLEILFEIKIQTLSNDGCRLVKYVIVASRAMSAWILVILSVERMLVLAIPQLSASMNTRLRATIGTIAVIIIQGVIYLYNFFTSEIREWGSCYWSRHVRDNYYDVILNIFDFLNYSVIPSVIMATSNVVLLFLLKHSQEIRRHNDRDIKGNVIIIISMSVAFIVLTTPMTIYQVLYVSGVDTGPEWIYPVLYSLNLLNHAINFFLYCLSGPGFRKEIVTLFRPMCRCICKKMGPTEGTDITSMELSSPSNAEKGPGDKDQAGDEPGKESEDKEKVQSEPIDIPRAPPNIYDDLQQREPQAQRQVEHNEIPSVGQGVQNDEHVYCDINDSEVLVDATQNDNAASVDVPIPDSSLTYPKEVYKNPIAVEHWVD